MFALRSCCRSLGLALARANPPPSFPLHQQQLKDFSTAQALLAGSYFQRRPADQLWKAATSVSNKGRQRGRARGLMRIKNLHRGQRLGMGNARVNFPGLSSGALNKDRERQEISPISEEAYTSYIDDLEEIRAKMSSKRGMLRSQTPLERGWTGASPKGRHFGKPISANPRFQFDDFDSILLDHSVIVSMDGVLGRTRSLRLLMVTGNKKGTAGFALVRSPTGQGAAAYQRAVSKAGVRLVTVPLYENRTVFHDFFSNFGKTRILVKQKPPGHGIKAQRAVAAICELVGIQDMEAVIEGADRNYLHICKAFFLGLLRQRTHQELANEKRLHLVEFRQENGNFPRVVASPNNGPVRTKEEIGPNEILDFEMITFDGHLPVYAEEKPPFYHALPSWAKNLKKRKPFEHHAKQKRDMLVEQGRISSHLTGKYPECKSVGKLPLPPAEL